MVRAFFLGLPPPTGRIILVEHLRVCWSRRWPRVGGLRHQTLCLKLFFLTQADLHRQPSRTKLTTTIIVQVTALLPPRYEGFIEIPDLVIINVG